LTIAWRRVAYGFRLLVYRSFYGSAEGVVAIGRGVVFSPTMRLSLGRDVWLGAYGIFQGEGRVSVGSRTYIGSHFSINSIDEISIGRNCMFGNMVSLVDNNHGVAAGDVAFRDQPSTSKKITIEDACWIGEKVAILEGVRIGRGSIVAAGAVVREDVDPGTVVGGVPARVLKKVT
jgi:acetyltransferase-like isoleucine patch superfamily enzyme